MRLIFTVLILALTFTSSAQSISGKLKSNESSESLGYGNVDIYKDKKLVASVLTDAEGNFSVPLDTGYYECVFNFAGHKEKKYTIRVADDEKGDFDMDRDPAKPLYKAPLVEDLGSPFTGGSAGMSLEGSAVSGTRGRSDRGGGGLFRNTSGPPPTTSAPPSFSFDRAAALGYSKGETATSGKLTAGEVNDFSKWEMWQGYAKNELKSHADAWEIKPSHRYTLQLRSKNGLPLADAKVKLKSGSTVLYAARTDNTGRAELWASMDGSEPKPGRKSLEVNYRGKTETVRNATPFTESINYLAMDVECYEMNNVDIAFVVDATGSMSDELNYLKVEMNDVIYKSKQISSTLNFHFANVFYRDKGDAYVTRSMDFSRVLSESVQFISEQHANGGGDSPEAVEFALDSAIHHLSWNEEARTRVIFLILDAPPHNTAANRKKMNRLVKDAAEKGIRIVPVGASGIDKATEYLMRALAIGSNGTYTFLTDHSGIGNPHIEPTTDSYKVETFNDLMVRVLKSYTYMPSCDQTIPDLALDYPDSLVTVPGDSIADVDTLASSYDSIMRDHHHTWVLPDVQWSYYPNPTNGILNIKADVDIDEIFLTDLSGKLLQSIKKLERDRIYQMDLSSYTTGIYLIRYLHEDRWISGKVVLQHGR